MTSRWRWALPIGVATAALYWLIGFPVQPVMLGLLFVAASALVADLVAGRAPALDAATVAALDPVRFG